jgi:DNA-binding response OmpR family regulator
VQGDCELRQMSSDQQKTLVIAEEASASSQLRRTLEVLGFDAAEVLSYEDALSCLRLFDYDAILLECSVFGRKVTAVCRELRRLYPRLPILAVGVDKSLDNMVALLEAGADDYTILPLLLAAASGQMQAGCMNQKHLKQRSHANSRWQRLPVPPSDCEMHAKRSPARGRRIGLR